MSNLNKEIEAFNTAVAFVQASVPDIETLPLAKREFYQSVMNIVNNAIVIINAKQAHIKWLEASNIKSKDIAYKQLHKEFNDLLSLARCKGVDVDLIRYA